MTYDQVLAAANAGTLTKVEWSKFTQGEDGFMPDSFQTITVQTALQAHATGAQAWVKKGIPNAQSTIPNPLSGIAAVGNFFNVLGEPQVWIRAAEVVIGGVIVLFSINKLAGNPAGTAAKVAAIVPK